MSVAILGAGAGGSSAAVDLSAVGHRIALWGRSADGLRPFQQRGGVGFSGVLGQGTAPLGLITPSLREAIDDAAAAVIMLPTFSHGPLARLLAQAGWPADRPVVLNPGHTGGALEFVHAFRSVRSDVPPVAEFSTLTYVARKNVPDTVTISSRAKRVRAACLPGGKAALEIARTLFPMAIAATDSLAVGLANVNMVLHPPGAVLGAAWVEARAGDYTFYVDGMTPGVARTMKRLDDERRAVAQAFGHDLPNLIQEMKAIGTVEPDFNDTTDYRAAVAGGAANRAIRAPGTLAHRYYKEDFGHGLLPFLEIAAIAGVDTPIAASLFQLGEALTGNNFRQNGRTAEAMGIAGLSKSGLLAKVRQ